MRRSVTGPFFEFHISCHSTAHGTFPLGFISFCIHYDSSRPPEGPRSTRVRHGYETRTRTRHNDNCPEINGIWLKRMALQRRGTRSYLFKFGWADCVLWSMLWANMVYVCEMRVHGCARVSNMRRLMKKVSAEKLRAKKNVSNFGVVRLTTDWPLPWSLNAECSTTDKQIPSYPMTIDAKWLKRARALGRMRHEFY